MRNTSQFQTTPGFGNFNSNTGSATQTLWGETTGYGYTLGGTAPYGLVNSSENFSSHPLYNTLENTLGFNAPSQTQGIFSTVLHGQALLQSLFSETGLVLGPITGGADSFLGTGLEAGQFGAISRFINLVQGVSSAQAIAYSGITGGQYTTGNRTGFGVGTSQAHGNLNGQGFGGTGQGFGNLTGQAYGAGTGNSFGNSPLASLIHVRYYDNNSAFIIECAIVGGNPKSLNATVVGEEIRIQKTDSTSTEKNLSKTSNAGNSGTYYSLPLPNSADTKGITATAKDGILTITLPKTQEISKNVRQITVK